MRANELYATHIESFLHSLRKVKASKREYYDALRVAIEELEIELQACKETLDDN